MIDPVFAVTLTAVPLIAPLISALAPKLTLPPAFTVIGPKTDVTVEPITILAAGAKATKEMPPMPVVVMPLVVKLPVPAVKVKLTPVNAAFTSVDVTLLVIAYVVSPSAPSKAIV